jgi:hypothetical protein
MKELPRDWLNKLEIGETGFDHDLDERCEYADLEAARHAIMARSQWRWGNN